MILCLSGKIGKGKRLGRQFAARWLV